MLTSSEYNLDLHIPNQRKDLKLLLILFFRQRKKRN